MVDVFSIFLLELEIFSCDRFQKLSLLINCFIVFYFLFVFDFVFAFILSNIFSIN